MNLIKFSVKRELDYKYLQFNLLIDCLDEMIAEAKSKPIQDIQMLKKIAGLRVFKKNFETQR